MRTDTNPETQTPTADRLAEHHRQLDRQFEQLVTRAREADGSDLRGEWTNFERALSRHLEFEETEILPGFAQHDAAGAAAILADHAAIRQDLLEMGVNLDLHLLRTEAVEGFVRRLGDHARREEAALYPWAIRHGLGQKTTKTISPG
jgi:hemerythrin superfamily protein